MRMGEYLMFSGQDQSYQVNVPGMIPSLSRQWIWFRHPGRTAALDWGKDGLRAQAILQAFYRSAEISKPVQVESVL